MTDNHCTTRRNVFHFWFYNAQNHVDIVNHQVKHYRHIGTTRVELCQAVCLDEHRVVNLVAYCYKGRVKTLYVTHLSFHVMFLSKGDNRFSFFYCSSDRFFDKEVFARFDNLFSTHKVIESWSYHIHHITFGNKGFYTIKTLVAKFFAHFLSISFIGVVKTYEFISIRLVEQSQMYLS